MSLESDEIQGKTKAEVKAEIKKGRRKKKNNIRKTRHK